MSPEFIAEVSSNHNRDLKRSLAFIDLAAQIGCSAVKFQLFKIEELFAPEVLGKKRELRERKQWELPVEFLPDLSRRAHQMEIGFGCTPFYLKAVEELLPYVDFYKIASYELLWSDLLVEVARTGKRVILSTGMATMEEIGGSLAVLRANGAKDVTLLHCVSSYPAPVEDCNLSAIESMRKSFGCPIGWSDHSVSEGVLYRSVHSYGASVIEFHLDIDDQGFEHKSGHNWAPQQIKRVIDTVRIGMSADGTGVKSFAQSELADREWRADPSDGLRPMKKIRAEIGDNVPDVD
ncbi:MAG: N-acetylneuraminate synthase family protein [Bacteroidetes bacterium]|nr:N-acetylneuraminate synthase family protein [Bacteroidota bacterium]